ncbi:MAG: hypothetical protein C4575_09510 [Desulforudis sp.]|nr:MAG: hypothetical protein C4575_09510 [Desulforudis sp.]
MIGQDPCFDDAMKPCPHLLVKNHQSFCLYDGFPRRRTSLACPLRDGQKLQAMEPEKASKPDNQGTLF